MKKLVIIPGGFHPFHAGHKALYDKAVETFPSADVYIAASDDRSERPFPFVIKKKLAQLAGVPPHRFIQVKSPFKHALSALRAECMIDPPLECKSKKGSPPCVQPFCLTLKRVYHARRGLFC